MRELCDVAIVGGGVVGLSAACYLKHAGVDRVVVLEQHGAVGQGSSSRANGGVRAQFTTAVNILFSVYSIGELERLDEESDGLPSFHQTGYLLVSGTERGEEQLRRACELQRSLGVATEWLGPADIVERAPLIRQEGLRAGTFHARDGFLDPHGVVAALKLASQRVGAEIRTHTEVVGLEATRNGRFLVATSKGSFSAGWLVNAAGPSARRVGRMLQVDVPVEPVRRNLAYVRPPGHPSTLIRMCVDIDTGVLVRRDVGGGYVIAYSNPHDAPGSDTSVDPRFLEDVAARIGTRFPTLEDVAIDLHHCWAGLYPETVDHHAIIGPAPAIENFILCVGFGGHGIMHAPAAGEAVAELITEGKSSTFDLQPLRPTRFEEGDLVVETAVL